MDLSYLDVGLRLGAAALAGGTIGINRDLADRPIGTRTLGLVALGAAVVAVASIQVAGMAQNPDAMSRVVQGIIQGVMAGISFIGAGVILRNAQARTVEGLTTAATVWVTAALGLPPKTLSHSQQQSRSPVSSGVVVGNKTTVEFLV